MFASPTKAKLQEIGPKFTLKLRWLRKGLPGVLTADGVAPHAKNADQESEEEEGDEEKDEETKEDVEMEDSPAQDEAGDAEGEPTEKKSKKEKNVVNGVKIPALDEEQEYEWKWKVRDDTCPNNRRSLT